MDASPRWGCAVTPLEGLTGAGQGWPLPAGPPRGSPAARDPPGARWLRGVRAAPGGRRARGPRAASSGRVKAPFLVGSPRFPRLLCGVQIPVLFILTRTGQN